MKKTFKFAAAAGLLLSAFSAFADTFVFTAIPDEDESRLQQRFNKVADYLSAQTGAAPMSVCISVMDAIATAQARPMGAMGSASTASTAATNIPSHAITGLNFAAPVVCFVAMTDRISPDAVSKIGRDPA